MYIQKDAKVINPFLCYRLTDKQGDGKVITAYVRYRLIDTQGNGKVISPYLCDHVTCVQ